MTGRAVSAKLTWVVISTFVGVLALLVPRLACDPSEPPRPHPSAVGCTLGTLGHCDGHVDIRDTSR